MQKPLGQYTAGLESCVVLFPVCGAVAGLTGVAHAASLPLAEQRFMQQRPYKVNIHARAIGTSSSLVVYLGVRLSCRIRQPAASSWVRPVLAMCTVALP